MIDQNARNQLQSMQTAKAISAGIEKLSDAIKGGKGEGGQMVLANEFRELQKVLSQEALAKLKALIDDLDGKLNSLTDLEKNLPRKIELEFPKEYPVTGDVGIKSLPPVHIQNLEELAKLLGPLLNNLQTATFKAIGANKPLSSLAIKDPVQVKDFQELLDGIDELVKGFNILINKEAATVGFPSSTIPVEIQNWKIPQPVTNVSINPNRGTVLATAVTVTTALTPLPATALADRRSMTFYNNGAVTIYIGGSNMTTATGIPVAAGTYGPSLDVGPNSIIYARTSSSTCDVRVLEMNDTVSGGDN